MSIFNPMGGRMAMLDMLQRRRQMDQAAVSSVADPLGQAATEINRGVGQQINLQDLAIRQAEEARRKQAEYERLRGIASDDVLGALMAENQAYVTPRTPADDGRSANTDDILGPSTPSANVSTATGATTPASGGVHDFVAQRPAIQPAPQQQAGFQQVLPPELRAQSAPSFEPELPAPIADEVARRYKKMMAEKGFVVDDAAAMSAAQSSIDQMRKAYDDNVKANMARWESTRKRAIEDLELNSQQAVQAASYEKTVQQIRNNFPENVSNAWDRVSSSLDEYANNPFDEPAQFRDTFQKNEWSVISDIARQINYDPKDPASADRLKNEVAKRFEYHAGRAGAADIGRPGKLVTERMREPVPKKDITGQKFAPTRGAAAERIPMKELYRGTVELGQLTNLFDELAYGNVQNKMDTGAWRDWLRRNVAEKIGMNPDTADGEFYQRLGEAFSLYIKSISGATVTDKEAERLFESFPNSKDDQDRLLQKLGTATSSAQKRFKDTYGSNVAFGIYEQGKNKDWDLLGSMPVNSVQGKALNRAARRRLEQGRPVEAIVTDVFGGRSGTIVIQPGETEKFDDIQRAVEEGRALYKDVY